METIDGATTLAAAAEYIAPPDFRWTKDVAGQPLPSGDVDHIVERATAELTTREIVLPDAERTVRRCVSALLVGHLILQGPPGTGKTTLARILARSFDAQLEHTTATSEWSPFQVVGGLRPNSSGGLEAVLGSVPRTALTCAEIVKGSVENGLAPTSGAVAEWLLIDEFNRADIDKAIGALYTVLSSSDPDHLVTTPLDLWFMGSSHCRKLWIPARFRIIGTMNDLDTNYVSAMSQGLRRRFQFVTIGIPEGRGGGDSPVSSEVRAAVSAAWNWISTTYPNIALAEPTLFEPGWARLQRVLDGLRWPEGGALGWPVGTAQVVDVAKSVILANAPEDSTSLDLAIADRMVAQMNTVNRAQFERFSTLMLSNALPIAAQELHHLYQPYTTA